MCPQSLTLKSHSTADLQLIPSYDLPDFLLQNWHCKQWTGRHVRKGVLATSLWISLPFASWVKQTNKENKKTSVYLSGYCLNGIFFCIHVEAERFLSMSCQGSRKIIECFAFIEDFCCGIFLLEFPGNQASLLTLSNYTSLHRPHGGNKSIERNVSQGRCFSLIY